MDTENRNLSEGTRAGFFARMAAYWLDAYRRIDVVSYEIPTPKLPVGESLTVAILSDIHADKRFMPLSRVGEAVAITNALLPDLIYLGGDLLAQDNWVMTPESLEDLVQVLGGLTAPLGVFATTGNHDWWDDKETQARVSDTPKMVRLLEAAGVQVLRNEARPLPDSPNGPIWVAALDSQWAYKRKDPYHEGAHDLKAALRDVPPEAFSLLLAHEPDIFPSLPKRDLNGPIDLVLSGHTHGGQIKIFNTTPVLPSIYGSRYAYGHCREEGRDLIVTGGLGCSLLPLRFGVTPEVVLVRIEGTEPLS